jgi:hypothetical protein
LYAKLVCSNIVLRLKRMLSTDRGRSDGQEAHDAAG